jgi:integrase
MSPGLATGALDHDSIPPNARYERVEQLLAVITDIAGAGGRDLQRGTHRTRLRCSELVGLRVRDVSLLERRLTVRNTVVEIAGVLHEGPPKTSSGERTMTIPAFIADLIGEQVGRHRSKAGYMFSSPEGGPPRKTFIGRVFRPAVQRAELEPLRFHDLRHTAAAISISLGAHPKVIQTRLGHSSIKTTLDVYGHLLPNLDVALADALDRLAGDTAAAYVLPEASLAAVPAVGQPI